MNERVNYIDIVAQIVEDEKKTGRYLLEHTCVIIDKIISQQR